MRLLVLAVLLAATPAWAQRNEVALLAGYATSADIEKKAAGVQDLALDGGFTLSLQAGHFFTPHIGVEASWARQDSAVSITTTSGSADLFDVDVDRLHGSVVYRFGSERARLEPFVFAGLGATLFSATDLERETKLSWAVGTGLSAFLGKGLGARVQMRYNPTHSNDELSDFCDPFGFCQGWLQQFEFMGGLSFRF